VSVMTENKTEKTEPLMADHATADDSYATCPRCKWAGKLRKDGTMRKHRESVDMGHFTLSGGLPQQPDGDICQGSGEKPWEPGLPEGYELPEKNEHGGWRCGEHTPAPRQDPTPEPEAPSQTAPAKPRYEVQQLGPGYFAVLDTVTGMHVFAALGYATPTVPAIPARYRRDTRPSSRERAHARAAKLNEESN